MLAVVVVGPQGAAAEASAATKTVELNAIQARKRIVSRKTSNQMLYLPKKKKEKLSRGIL